MKPTKSFLLFTLRRHVGANKPEQRWSLTFVTSQRRCFRGGGFNERVNQIVYLLCTLWLKSEISINVFVMVDRFDPKMRTYD